MTRQETDALVNFSAERWLLSACMIDATIIPEVSGMIQVADFTDANHRRLYEALLNLPPRSDRPEADVSQLGKNADALGGMEYLVEVGSAVPAAANWRTDADSVADAAARRRIVLNCQEAQHAATKADASVPEIKSRLEKAIADVGRAGVEPVTSAREAIKAAINAADRVSQGLDPPNTKTGIAPIDTLTGGIGPEELIVLAGRTSHGKTTLGLNFAVNIASAGGHVLIFSLEMGAANLAMNMQAQMSGVTRYRVNCGRLTADEGRRLAAAVIRFGALPIHLAATASVGVSDVESLARSEHRKHPLALVIVDYLQLLRTNRRENRNLEIGEAVRSLKQLALSTRVPVLLLSQLRRGDAKGVERYPRLEDLRDSGEIENHADAVWAIHRPRKGLCQDDKTALGKDGKESEDSVGWFLVLKARNGPLGEAPLAWNPEFMRYEAR